MQLLHLNEKEKDFLYKNFSIPPLYSFEDVLEILNIVHSLALHDGNIPAKTCSCFDIIDQAEKLKILRCVEYSYLLVQILIAYNIPARVIGLKKKTVETDEHSAGHIVTEFWSIQFNKWVMLDPQYAIYFSFENIPLSCVDIMNIGISNVHTIRTKNSRLEESNIQNYKAWLNEYLYYIDTPVIPDQNLTNEQRISEIKHMIIPRGATIPKIFQRTHSIVTQVLDVNEFYKKPDVI